MRLRAGTGLCFLSLVLGGIVIGHAQETKTTNISQATILDQRDRQLIAKMREHAWNKFAEITETLDIHDPKSPPVWDSWEGICVAVPSGTSLPSTQKQRNLQLPLELVADFRQRYSDDNAALKDAANFLKNPNASIGTEVLYNPPACRHIRELEIENRRKTFVGLNAPAREREIEAFPPTAIVVKASWRTVGPQYPERISIWYSSNKDLPNCLQGCIDTIKVRIAGPDEPCNLPVAQGADVVTSCFYNVSDPESPENRLILVALHMITKEVPDWTWSTFWWHLEPNIGPYAAQKPRSAKLRGIWRNYLMDTTLSTETPWEGKSRTGDPSPVKDPCLQDITQPSRARICFNPYIEGGLKNGRISNCMNCHKRAAYPAMIPVVERGYLSPDSACFDEPERKITLDYLWSLIPFEANPLEQFRSQLKAQLLLLQSNK